MMLATIILRYVGVLDLFRKYKQMMNVYKCINVNNETMLVIKNHISAEGRVEGMFKAML